MGKKETHLFIFGEQRNTNNFSWCCFALWWLVAWFSLIKTSRACKTQCDCTIPRPVRNVPFTKQSKCHPIEIESQQIGCQLALRARNWRLLFGEPCYFGRSAQCGVVHRNPKSLDVFFMTCFLRHGTFPTEQIALFPFITLFFSSHRSHRTYCLMPLCVCNDAFSECSVDLPSMLICHPLDQTVLQ
eukprot:70020-Amphidinium_carterae.3